MPKKTTTKSTTKKTTKKSTVRAKTSATKKKAVAKKTAKTVTKKTVTKKVAAKKKPSAKKATTARAKTTTKKAVAKKAVAKKVTATKTVKKTVTKKTVTKKATTKKVMEAPVVTPKVIPESTEPATTFVEDETVVVKRKRPVNAAAGPLGFTPYVEKKGEEYMCTEQVKHFGNILNLWKHQLMQEVDSTVGHMKEDDNVYADPVDRASMEADFNLELRTRDRERKLIRKIESVMDDLDRGEYGYCEDCGADIGIRRLEARPTATKCIDCKTFQEIKEKQGS